MFDDVLAKFAFQYLPHSVLGKCFEEEPVTRYLKISQQLRAVLLQFLFSEAYARTGHHTGRSVFAQRSVRHRYYRRFKHTGAAIDRVLHCSRCDLEAAAINDVFLTIQEM